MNSTIYPETAEARFAHAYQQIAEADEQLARVTAKLSSMEVDSGPRRAAAYNQGGSRGGAARRGLFAVAVAALIGGAAYAAHSPRGEAARQAIAPFVPSYVSASWLARPPAPALPGSSPVQFAAATATSPPAASAVQDQPPAAVAAPSTAELMQTMQTMSQDIATLQQGVEQLRTNQMQVASDNAKAIEQIRADQEQLRVAAKPPEKPPVKPALQDARARLLTPPPGAPRPVAVAARRAPLAPPSQVRPRTQPGQLQPAAQ